MGRATDHDVHVVVAHDPPESGIWGSRPASFLASLALNLASEPGFFFLFRGASEPVIQSAEGAKDLLLGAEPALQDTGTLAAAPGYEAC